MARDPGPVFLERRSYRRRRLADAARLLPLFGAVLICIPLLWQPGGAAGDGAGDATRTTSAMLYLFGLWLALAVVSGVISAWLPLGDDARGLGGQDRGAREGDGGGPAGGEGG